MGGNETKSTVTQSNIPEYARPYFEKVMNEALSESQRPYQPYQDQRLADMSGSTQQGLGMATNYAQSGTPLLDQGSGAVGQVAGQDFSGTADQFTSQVADQYMSPYMQAVVDKAKQDAAKNAMEEQTMRNADFARSGAFGGSRAAVQNQMAAGQLQSRLTDIDVQGAQAAFENAQQQFERDRSAGFQNRELNQRGSQLNLEAGSRLGEMQSLQDELSLQRIKSMLATGQTQEEYKQRELDMAYNDFVNQRDSGRQNIQFLSSILRGVPISADQDVRTSEPTNPLAGLLGTASGLQALQALSKQQ